MPEDRPLAPMPMDTGGSAAGVSGAYEHSSAASDSGSEAAAPVTEAQRERQLRELQLQVCSDTLSRTSPVHSTETHLYMPYVLNKSETRL